MSLSNLSSLKKENISHFCQHIINHSNHKTECHLIPKPDTLYKFPPTTQTQQSSSSWSSSLPHRVYNPTYLYQIYTHFFVWKSKIFPISDQLQTKILHKKSRFSALETNFGYMALCNRVIPCIFCTYLHTFLCNLLEFSENMCLNPAHFFSFTLV